MAQKALLKNTLSQYAFLPVNRCLIKNLGLTEAALVAMLVDSEALNQDENGWFYLTSAMGQGILNLGRKPYESAINNIVDAGIVETELRGCPPKKYFKLNHSVIVSILGDEYLTGMDNSICPDGTIQFDQNGQINLFETDNKKEHSTNNNINNKNKTKNSGSQERKKKGLDLSFMGLEYQVVFERWLKHKSEKRQSYTQSGIEAQYRRLLKMSNGDARVADQIVEYSIAQNYDGIYPPDELKQSKQQSYGNSTQTGGGFFCQLADTIKRAN